MVPGVRKQWEQVIAYYFTSKNGNNFTTSRYLVIVLATVCDQGATNCAALRELCDQRHPRQSFYISFVG
jgi:hypothetical protein